MLTQVHEHIVSELQQNARTDTIFVVTAIAFNLIVLGINSGIAGEAGSPHADASINIILWVFIAMSILVNAIAVTALNTGRKTREKLLGGIIAMYEDNQVSKYYHSSLLKGYGTRYLLFTGVILWVPTIVTQFVPTSVIQTARSVHGLTAILAILAVLVGHLYFTLLLRHLF